MKQEKTLGIIGLTILVLITCSVFQITDKQLDSIIPIEEDFEKNARVDGNPIFHVENSTHYQNYSTLATWNLHHYDTVEDLVVVGNVTFLGTDDGVFIYNTTTAFPTLLSGIPTSHDVETIAVENDTLYYFYFDTFVIANISDLTDPQELYRLEIGSGYHFVVEDSLAYISIYNPLQSIQIYDCTNPINPIFLGDININHYFTAKKDDYLLIFTSSYNMFVYDVSNPTTPTQVNQMLGILTLIDFYMDGDYLYLVLNNGISVYEFISASNILLRKTIVVNNIRDFTMENSIGYIMYDYFSPKIQIRNFTDLDNITIINTFIAFSAIYYYGDTCLHVNNSIVTASFSYSKVVRFNVSDPINVSLLSEFFSGRIIGIEVFDSYAIVCFRENGFKVYDISDIRDPIFVSSVSILGLDDQPILNGDICYVIQSSKLYIYNLTDPHNPTKLAEYETVSGIQGIDFYEQTAFLEVGTTIEIVNITNPSDLLHIGFYESDVVNFDIQDNLLYIITDSLTPGNLKVVNITDPTNPTQLIETELSITANSIKSNGKIAFTYHTGSTTVEIFNVTNPNDLNQSTNDNVDSVVNEALLDDYRIYIINKDNGLLVMDLDGSFDLEFSGKLSTYDGSFSSLSDKHEFNDSLIFIGNNYDVVVVGLDTDADLLPDYLEVNIYGTNPNNPDTDSDLMFDWYEVEYSLDPFNATDAGLNYDSDTLTNLEEYYIESNPWLGDSDSDSLTDDQEALYNTDPNDPDSDGDNLDDYEEIIIYNTDPLDSDSDDDKLSDFNEIRFYNTDPLNNDTDGDLLNDYYELVNFLNPLLNDSHLDLDSDGLTNYEEYILGTSAKASDSDQDGYTDYEEVQEGTDPLDSTDYPDYPAHPTTVDAAPLPAFACTVAALLFLGALGIMLSHKQSQSRRIN